MQLGAFVGAVTTLASLATVNALINPILPGWNPDPSITRVGADYFLATSSFEYFPGHPIYHSTDLYSWRLIGHALNRPSQLALFGTPEDGGLWGPTLRYHEETATFHLFSTARYAYTAEYRLFPRSFFVMTKDIWANSWSDPVYFDNLGYDQGVFWDPSGDVYAVWSGINNAVEKIYSIYQSKIDIHTGSALTPSQIIFRGVLPDNSTARPEGPHLYLINDTYYLLIAEGGSTPEHRSTIQRGPSPSGPWEENPANPILFNGANESLPVQYTGHADIVEGPDGRWWGVALGTRPQRPGDFTHMQLGRETFLFPVTWVAGWPVFNGGQPLAEHLPGVLEDVSPLKTYESDFASIKTEQELWLDGYYALRTPYKPFWSTTAREGYLRLSANAYAVGDRDSPALLLRKQTAYTETFEVELDFTPPPTNPSGVDALYGPNGLNSGFGLGPEAGVSVFYSDLLHNEIGVVGGGLLSTGNGSAGTAARALVARQTTLNTQVGPWQLVYTNSTLTNTAFYPLSTTTGPIRFRVSASPLSYTLSYAESGDANFTDVLEIDSSALSVPPTGGFFFQGAAFGMYNTGNGQVSLAPADFRDVKQIPVPPGRG
ncbi:Non-reducing end alpha-L-arabinofuranosidase BoGH43B [Mycena chlorophos]|uniref:Non-reducing end alpha-L-arabinofuranosidase BoGH43B n=1 Tax=Mycena chlorophos TaxID=658473 RepID=A0A8H6W764_MYCCL|nr:Non-reducing end alpha-L-arabinofuranosidase BoGH43B [Mycena chlorophos]